MLNTTQKALYDILSIANYEVYDIIPEGVEMPFIKLGDTSFNEVRMKGYETFEVTHNIELWTDGTGKGRKETNTHIMQIIDLIKGIGQDLGSYILHDISFQEESNVNEVILEDTTVLFQSNIKVTFKIEQKGA